MKSATQNLLPEFPWQAAPKDASVDTHRSVRSDQALDRTLRELIDLFSARVRKDRNAVEEYLLLGRLFRFKGQSKRALKVHQNLLARPRLPKRLLTDLQVELGYDLEAYAYVSLDLYYDTGMDGLMTFEEYGEFVGMFLDVYCPATLSMATSTAT